MLTYNTQRRPLPLPEYGRNIQQMVDHCLTIADRDERTAAAWAVVGTMQTLFPELRTPENENKAWDSLALMSGFQLDIDWPCEVVTAEALAARPQPIPYNNTAGPQRMRHYGRLVPQMVEKVLAMDADDPMRQEAIFLLANQMKKQSLLLSPEGYDDMRIFADLAALTDGAIRIAPEQMVLFSYKAAPVQRKKRRK